MVAAMPRVTVSRCLSISLEGAKCQPWIVQDAVLVNGTEYIHLKSSCSGFCRFVVGKLRFSGAGSQSIPELQQQRTVATLEHVVKEDQGESIFDDVLPTEKCRKRARKTALEKQQLPDYVTVHLPDIVDGDNIIDGVAVKMLPSIDRRAAVHIEVTPQNLAYIRTAANAAESDSKRNEELRRSGDANVRWRADRKVWLALRGTPIIKKGMSKCFKVSDVNDEIAVEEAKAAALRWAQGCDGDSDHECDDAASDGNFAEECSPTACIAPDVSIAGE